MLISTAGLGPSRRTQKNNSQKSERAATNPSPRTKALGEENPNSTILCILSVECDICLASYFLKT